MPRRRNRHQPKPMRPVFSNSLEHAASVSTSPVLRELWRLFPLLGEGIQKQVREGKVDWRYPQHTRPREHTLLPFLNSLRHLTHLTVAEGTRSYTPEHNNGHRSSFSVDPVSMQIISFARPLPLPAWAPNLKQLVWVAKHDDFLDFLPEWAPATLEELHLTLGQSVKHARARKFAHQMLPKLLEERKEMHTLTLASMGSLDQEEVLLKIAHTLASGAGKSLKHFALDGPGGKGVWEVMYAAAGRGFDSVRWSVLPGVREIAPLPDSPAIREWEVQEAHAAELAAEAAAQAAQGAQAGQASQANADVADTLQAIEEWSGVAAARLAGLRAQAIPPQKFTTLNALTLDMPLTSCLLFFAHVSSPNLTEMNLTITLSRASDIYLLSLALHSTIPLVTNLQLHLRLPKDRHPDPQPEQETPPVGYQPFPFLRQPAPALFTPLLPLPYPAPPEPEREDFVAPHPEDQPPLDREFLRAQREWKEIGLGRWERYTARRQGLGSEQELAAAAVLRELQRVGGTTTGGEEASESVEEGQMDEYWRQWMVFDPEDWTGAGGGSMINRLTELRNQEDMSNSQFLRLDQIVRMIELARVCGLGKEMMRTQRGRETAVAKAFWKVVGEEKEKGEWKCKSMEQLREEGWVSGAARKRGWASELTGEEEEDGRHGDHQGEGDKEGAMSAPHEAKQPEESINDEAAVTAADVLQVMDDIGNLAKKTIRVLLEGDGRGDKALVEEAENTYTRLAQALNPPEEAAYPLPLHWSAFAPLLACRNMRDFRLTVPSDLDFVFDASDLQLTAERWPELEVFLLTANERRGQEGKHPLSVVRAQKKLQRDVKRERREAEDQALAEYDAELDRREYRRRNGLPDEPPKGPVERFIVRVRLDDNHFLNFHDNRTVPGIEEGETEVEYDLRIERWHADRKRAHKFRQYGIEHWELPAKEPTLRALDALDTDVPWITFGDLVDFTKALPKLKHIRVDFNAYNEVVPSEEEVEAPASECLEKIDLTGNCRFDKPNRYLLNWCIAQWPNAKINSVWEGVQQVVLSPGRGLLIADFERWEADVHAEKQRMKMDAETIAQLEKRREGEPGSVEQMQGEQESVPVQGAAPETLPTQREESTERATEKECSKKRARSVDSDDDDDVVPDSGAENGTLYRKRVATGERASDADTVVPNPESDKSEAKEGEAAGDSTGGSQDTPVVIHFATTAKGKKRAHSPELEEGELEEGEVHDRPPTQSPSSRKRLATGARREDGNTIVPPPTKPSLDGASTHNTKKRKAALDAEEKKDERPRKRSKAQHEAHSGKGKQSSNKRTPLASSPKGDVAGDVHGIPVPDAPPAAKNDASKDPPPSASTKPASALVPTSSDTHASAAPSAGASSSAQQVPSASTQVGAGEDGEEDDDGTPRHTWAEKGKWAARPSASHQSHHANPLPHPPSNPPVPAYGPPKPVPSAGEGTLANAGGKGKRKRAEEDLAKDEERAVEDSKRRKRYGGGKRRR